MAAAGLPEKQWVGRSFTQAAARYDQVAALQRKVAEALLQRLPDVSQQAEMLLDLGAGTGYCSWRLAQRLPRARVLALDIAWGMLSAFRPSPGGVRPPWRVCGDGESLPVRRQSVDLVFSNLVLQWCPQLGALFQECHRVLRPSGVMLFSTFGESTLSELRAAWAEADSHTHVNQFPSIDRLVNSMQAAGFGEIALNSELELLTYPSVMSMMAELKTLGAHNVTDNRPRHLTGKGVMQKMMDSYARAMPGGQIQASYEAVYGLAVASR